jgi:hypothetical protein
VPARKATDRRSLNRVAETFGLDAAGLAAMAGADYQGY